MLMPDCERLESILRVTDAVLHVKWLPPLKSIPLLLTLFQQPLTQYRNI